MSMNRGKEYVEQYYPGTDLDRLKTRDAKLGRQYREALADVGIVLKTYPALAPTTAPATATHPTP
jgi:hypothetical protein